MDRRRDRWPDLAQLALRARRPAGGRDAAADEGRRRRRPGRADRARARRRGQRQALGAGAAGRPLRGARGRAPVDLPGPASGSEAHDRDEAGALAGHAPGVRHHAGRREGRRALRHALAPYRDRAARDPHPHRRARRLDAGARRRVRVVDHGLADGNGVGGGPADHDRRPRLESAAPGRAAVRLHDVRQRGRPEGVRRVLHPGLARGAHRRGRARRRLARDGHRGRRVRRTGGAEAERPRGPRPDLRVGNVPLPRRTAHPGGAGDAAADRDPAGRRRDEAGARDRRPPGRDRNLEDEPDAGAAGASAERGRGPPGPDGRLAGRRRGRPGTPRRRRHDADRDAEGARGLPADGLRARRRLRRRHAARGGRPSGSGRCPRRSSRHWTRPTARGSRAHATLSRRPSSTRATRSGRGTPATSRRRSSSPSRRSTGSSRTRPE